MNDKDHTIYKSYVYVWNQPYENTYTANIDPEVKLELDLEQSDLKEANDVINRIKRSIRD